jgi:excisionase family DNA binding protein
MNATHISALPSAEVLLFTRREVAAILRVSMMTVLRMVARNELPALRIGGGLRFRRTDVMGLLEGFRADPRKPLHYGNT